MKKRSILCVLGVVCVVTLMGTYHAHKPLPDGLRHEGVHRMSEDDITAYFDRTYLDEEGVRTSRQEIFDEVERMIAGADRYILVDMFLWNEFLGTATTSHRSLSGELTEALIAKKQSDSDITIEVISDPINTVYGGYASPHFTALEAAGIPVITTDLTKLRDSNPLYSAVWRTLFFWLGNSERPGILTNLFDPSKESVSVRSYIHLLNFKANHRKLIVADYTRDGGVGLRTLVTSANPHDGSSAHSNSALAFDSGVWRDVLVSERAVAHLSGRELMGPPRDLVDALTEPEGDIEVSYLTEGAIKDRILSELANTGAGDSISLSIFYLADRDVMEAFFDALDRGATMRALLDPNKDAFGREKDGTPNRQTAAELVARGASVRWCATRGEQCHSKSLLVDRNDESVLITGSANFTRRNLGDYNLETNVAVRGRADARVMVDTRAVFEAAWTNAEGLTLSEPYETYEEPSRFAYIRYRLMEATGLSNW